MTCSASLSGVLSRADSASEDLLGCIASPGSELLRPNGIMVFDDFRYQPVQQAIKDTLGPIVENRGQQFGKYFWIKE
jgi:hypothetical protein